MRTNILLVDDSPTILKLLSLGLRQEGYNVVTATDGLDALVKINQLAVDLLITDVNMPRMDGFALIKAIRTKKSVTDLPIIILSTESSENDKQVGLEAGANRYLVKPIQAAELLAQVKGLLN